MKNTFVHQVYFWLKDAADTPAFVEGLKTLEPISYAIDMHIGIPANTDKPVVDSSYHVSLLVLFKNKADHDAYQVHPIHEAFIAKYPSQLCSRVMVTDSVDA